MNPAFLSLFLGLATGGLAGFGLGCCMVFRDFGDVIDAGRVALYDECAKRAAR